MQEELERRARLENLQQGWRRARTLDSLDALPPAGPRDLSGLDTVMSHAYENQAYYFSHPGWIALTQIYQQVSGVLENLTPRTERIPQAAIQAARITTLASGLIARYAAKVGSYLDTRKQSETPGGQAMRALVRVAELHAAQAAGLDDGQKLDTPRWLITHMHQLSKAIQQTAPPPHPGPATGPDVDDPDDPVLDAALEAGGAVDPDLAEASQLMNALNELAGRARRAGHRLALDVRLHGMVETAQLRGFEMISGIARTVMRRYDNLGRGTEGRRNIAAMVFHYAEQRLERMRGTLSADQQRKFGDYETDLPPDRYFDALTEEMSTLTAELKAQYLRPEVRTDLQIRFLLAEKEIAAIGGDNDAQWATLPYFPPQNIVAGMQTDAPVEARLALIDALRRRVENNPFHRDAQFLNTVADRYAREIAGPAELSPQALAADLSVHQIRAVAEHVVEHGTLASPLALSETVELNLTHAQAERALAVLQRLNVVGPLNGLTPRETLTRSRDQLSNQLALLEQRLPNLLEMQTGAAELASFPVPDSATQAEPAPTTPAPAAVEPDQAQTPAQAPPTQSESLKPAPSFVLPELPQRDRNADRRHPGNLGASAASTSETPTDQDVAQVLEGERDRIKEVSESLIKGGEARKEAHPAPAETTPAKTANVDEAQHSAQQAQQTVGVGGVR
jgi:hypothetical protein